MFGIHFNQKALRVIIIITASVSIILAVKSAYLESWPRMSLWTNTVVNLISICFYMLAVHSKIKEDNKYFLKKNPVHYSVIIPAMVAIIYLITWRILSNGFSEEMNQTFQRVAVLWLFICAVLAGWVVYFDAKMHL